MMFITPMPPTSSPIELRITITSATVPVMRWKSSIICWAVESENFHRAGDAVEVLDHLLGSREREVVGLVVRHFALDAQDGAHLVLGLRQHAFIGDHDQHVDRKSVV